MGATYQLLNNEQVSGVWRYGSTVRGHVRCLLFKNKI
jgi:hypothetical protein